MSSFNWPPEIPASGSAVTSLNSLTGDLTLVAGTGITVTPAGSNITISATGGNAITALTGDVTATGPGSVASTIGANKVTNSQLAQMTTLTIKGNNTGGTANALDLSVGQVQTMLGTSGTNTGDLTLAAVDSTPNANGASLAAQVLTLQPADATHPGVVSTAAQTFGGVKTLSAIVNGVTSNSAAAAGVVGEIISSSVVPGSAVSLTSTTAVNLTSVSLTQGWWWVSGAVQYRPAATTSVTDIDSSINTTTNTLAGSSFRGNPSTTGQIEFERASTAYIPGGPIDQIIPSYGFFVSTTTTYYLVVQAFFTISTMTANGYVQFLRFR